MSTGCVLAIAIFGTGVFTMRFRKTSLAKFNIAVAHRITGIFAGWLPGFGILTHVGRKSEKSLSHSNKRLLHKWIHHRPDLEQPVGM